MCFRNLTHRYSKDLQLIKAAPGNRFNLFLLRALKQNEERTENQANTYQLRAIIITLKIIVTRTIS